MTRLTEHFSLEELTRSAKAQELARGNVPSGGVLGNLLQTAIGLEGVRAVLGVPLQITSGYRCPAVNAAVGGVADSAHLSGWAADFVAPQFGTPFEIVKKLTESELAFDKLIQEGGWVHVSFDPRKRQQTMTAHFAAGKATTYTQGV